MTDLMADLKQLLIHMTVCAAGLSAEPKIYGPLRLIDSARMLSEILLKEEPDNETLQSLVTLIAENEEKNMSDPETFYDMLQNSVLMLIDLE